jgi:hypothetical protein
MLARGNPAIRETAHSDLDGRRVMLIMSCGSIGTPIKSGSVFGQRQSAHMPEHGVAQQ